MMFGSFIWLILGVLVLLLIFRRGGMGGMGCCGGHHGHQANGPSHQHSNEGHSNPPR